MQRLTTSLASLVASISLALLPIAVVPFMSIVAEDQKGAIAALLLGVALIVASGIAVVSRVAFSVRPVLYALLGVPVLLVAMLSASLNGVPHGVWLGEAFELGSVGSLALFALALFLASMGTGGSGRLTIYVLVGAALVCGAVSAIAAFAGAGVGMFGNWPTVAMLVTLAAVCAATLADWSKVFDGRAWALAVASILLIACTLLFFNVVYVGVATCVLLISIVTRVAFFSVERADRLPVLSLLLVVCLISSVVLGMRNPPLRVPADLRPSLTATELVGGPLFATSLSRTLIGAGPERFASIWNAYRPQEFNQTPLWDTTFKQGNSAIATILIELGVVGVLAWLLPMLVLLIISVARANALSPVSVACTAGALCYYGASFFYTTSLAGFLVSGVLLGLALQALCTRPVALRTSTVPVRLVVALLSAALGVALVVVSVLQLTAMYYHARGVARYKAGDYAAAHAAFVHGERVWPTVSLYTDDASVLFATLNRATPSSLPSQDEIDLSIQTVDKAIAADHSDLAAALVRASLYLTLVGMRVSGADALASSSLAHARDLAPNRPEVPYLRAVLAAQLGNRDEAHLYIEKALDLKPDYQAVLTLQKQLSGH